MVTEARSRMGVGECWGEGRGDGRGDFRGGLRGIFLFSFSVVLFLSICKFFSLRKAESSISE